MRKPATLQQLLARTGGTPTVATLSRFIAERQTRVVVQRWSIGITAAIIFAILPIFFFDQLVRDARGMIIGAFFFLGLTAFIIAAFAAFAISAATGADRQEMAKAEHARDQLAKVDELNLAVQRIVGPFALCLRGFERERLGGSGASRPLHADEVRRLQSSIEYTSQMFTGVTPFAIERDNEIKQQKFVWDWIDQLMLFRTVRKLSPTVILDNFDLEPVKHRELVEADIHTLPTTSSTWWDVFLTLAERAAIVIVLLQQRSPSVVRELEHLSLNDTPYLIVTRPGMIKALQRLAPRFIENSAAVVLSDDIDAVHRHVAGILEAHEPRAMSRTAAQDATAIDRGENTARLVAQVSAAHQRADIDWSIRESVVSRLAPHHAIVKWLRHAKPSPYIPYAAIASISGFCAGAVFALLGWALSYVFKDASILLNVGLLLIPVAVIQFAIAIYASWNYDRRHDAISTRLRSVLGERSYEELMASFDIPEEELQWIGNVIDADTSIAAADAGRR